MTPRDPNVPVPLTRWLRGRVEVHFRSGHVADLNVSLHGAHSIRLQVDQAQGGESIDGLESHQGWIAARAEEVLLTQWSPDPDYGWRDTAPPDRDRLRRLGMKHGILGALAELWADRGGHPAYSVNVVSALFGLATKDIVTREKWDRIAEMLEGDDGAAFLTTVLNGLSPHAVPADSVDDGAEPEEAFDEEGHSRERHGQEGGEAGSDAADPNAPTRQPRDTRGDAPGDA